jgi:diguanylate cyclase (GGDEF)-like protein/PAS domain S-box-containing protein
MPENRIKLLLVEDDRVDQMAFERAVDSGDLPYDYVIAGSVASAREKLMTGRFDMIILDLLLGDGTAFDLIPGIKDTPFIIVTGSGDENKAVEAMRSGAWDYLIKDPERSYLKVLPAAVQNTVRRFRAEQQAREKELYVRAIIERVSDAIITVDERNVVESFNPAAERIFGFPAVDAAGKDVSQMVPALGTGETLPVREDLLAGKRREVLGIRGDGSAFPAECSVSDMWLDGRVRYIVSIKDITDQKELEKVLREQVVLDGLTGLYNKRALLGILNDEVGRSRRYHRTFVIIMLDIDHFKNVNDTYGHPAGDEVLKGVAALIKAGVRTQDKTARYGGEEFTVILAETDAAGGLVVAERLRRNIADHPFKARDHRGGEVDIAVTVSLGVASFPQDGDASEALISRADRALYEAKNSGRNCVKKAGT